MQARQHDVIIVGGGISGCALLYMLARYTDLKDIALVEKYSSLASLNTHGRNNSQTLHCGDIETNYTLEKAQKVKAAANMVVNYARQLPSSEHILYKYSKMVLGVGERECELLQKRYESFHPHYEKMRCWDADGISRIEPNVVWGRNERILALGVEDDYSAVNFHALADSFVAQAKQVPDKNVTVYLNTRVNYIRESEKLHRVQTNRAPLDAKFVVVSASGHSLLFAQSLGYGKEYACLPVAGSFYYAPDILNGKVYTVQNDKLPFAAIHGDPDLLVRGKTRFGPTALILPMLERHNYRTVMDFIRLFSLDSGVMGTMWDLVKVREIRNYILKNFMFEVPYIRQRLFLKDARKIVPTLQLEDLTFAKRIGGIRPVMIDKNQRKLHLGEAKINPGNGIIFNMTPSPGATSCLQNAEQDLHIIAAHMDCRVDETAITRELKQI
ncbi:MAG: FAD-dependent oxidoreductase [Gammaproteobacteria bacterium]